MDADLDLRAQFESGRNAGKSVKELIHELNVPKSTAYQWNAAIKNGDAENARPEMVAPPDVTTTRKRGAGGGAKRLTVRPISEETAGQLCAGMFFLASAMQNEREWLLTDDERRELAGPLADSLRVMPGPIADAVNTYSAPAVFLSSLTAVVMAKGNRIQHKRRAMIAAARNGNAHLRSVPDVTPPAPPATAAGDAQQNADLDRYEREKASPPAMEADVRAAMEAAKSGLTHLDETDAGAGAFAQ